MLRILSCRAENKRLHAVGSTGRDAARGQNNCMEIQYFCLLSASLQVFVASIAKSAASRHPVHVRAAARAASGTGIVISLLKRYFF
jgi:hypothetical protein